MEAIRTNTVFQNHQNAPNDPKLLPEWLQIESKLLKYQLNDYNLFISHQNHVIQMDITELPRPNTVFLNHQSGPNFPKLLPKWLQMASEMAAKVLKYQQNDHNLVLFTKKHVILMATTNLAYLMKPIRPKTVFLNHQGALIYHKMTSKKTTKVLEYQ